MNTIFWLLLGFVLGLVFIRIANQRTRDEKSLLAGGIVVGAWIYIPLAITGNADIRWLILEVIGAALFTVTAWAGIRYSVWWLVTGWATHILWDVGLHLIGDGDKFTGAWYPLLCAAFDFVVAIYILYLIKQEKHAADAQIPQ